METELPLKKIGKRLEKIRAALNIASQRQLAELLGVETNRYNNWANGRVAIPVEHASKLCALSGASLDYIYRGEVSALPIRLMTLLDPSPAERGKRRKSGA